MDGASRLGFVAAADRNGQDPGQFGSRTGRYGARSRRYRSRLNRSPAVINPTRQGRHLAADALALAAPLVPTLSLDADAPCTPSRGARRMA